MSIKVKTPEDFRQQSRPSLLLCGEPFSGKTTIAFQFPNVLFYDCDMKIGNAATRFPQKTDWGYVQPDIDDDGKAVPPEKRWDRLCALIEATAGDPQWETLVIDSLTKVDQYLQDFIIACGGSGKPLTVGGIPCMTMEMWRPFMMRMQKLITNLIATGKTIIVTAHVRTEKDEVTGILEYKPLIGGQLKDSIGKLFTDYWKCEATTTTPNSDYPDGIKRTVRTVPTARMMLGNSFGLPADFKFTYEEFAKYMQKARSKQ